MIFGQKFNKVVIYGNLPAIYLGLSY